MSKEDDRKYDERLEMSEILAIGRNRGLLPKQMNEVIAKSFCYGESDDFYQGMLRTFANIQGLLLVDSMTLEILERHIRVSAVHIADLLCKRGLTAEPKK
jgi:hypothetical protein